MVTQTTIVTALLCFAGVLAFAQLLLFVSVWIIRWRKKAYWLARWAKVQDSTYLLFHIDNASSLCIEAQLLALQGHIRVPGVIAQLVVCWTLTTNYIVHRHSYAFTQATPPGAFFRFSPVVALALPCLIFLYLALQLGFLCSATFFPRSLILAATFSAAATIYLLGISSGYICTIQRSLVTVEGLSSIGTAHFRQTLANLTRLCTALCFYSIANTASTVCLAVLATQILRDEHLFTLACLVPTLAVLAATFFLALVLLFHTFQRPATTFSESAATPAHLASPGAVHLEPSVQPTPAAGGPSHFFPRLAFLTQPTFAAQAVVAATAPPQPFEDLELQAAPSRDSIASAYSLSKTFSFVSGRESFESVTAGIRVSREQEVRISVGNGAGWHCEGEGEVEKIA
ncbi:hypothetical protein JCM10207_000870 [Rhodosporidiobolus poonsookiae]